MIAESEHTEVAVIDYIDALFGYAMVLTRNRSEAEDLVQETCLRAIKAVKHLRPESNTKSWLMTILRNIWLNQLRKQRRTATFDIDVSGISAADTIPEPSKDPHATYVSKIERELVRETIRHLPARFQEVILLREYEGLSYKEIADVLDCPVGTVMSRLARARSKLRTLLLITAQ